MARTQYYSIRILKGTEEKLLGIFSCKIVVRTIFENLVNLCNDSDYSMIVDNPALKSATWDNLLAVSSNEGKSIMIIISPYSLNQLNYCMDTINDFIEKL